MIATSPSRESVVESIHDICKSMDEIVVASDTFVMDSFTEDEKKILNKFRNITRKYATLANFTYVALGGSDAVSD